MNACWAALERTTTARRLENSLSSKGSAPTAHHVGIDLEVLAPCIRERSKLRERQSHDDVDVVRGAGLTLERARETSSNEVRTTHGLDGARC